LSQKLIIAVSGKGGTGKTATTALILRHLTEAGRVVLAVDANPDANLAEVLGIPVEKTISMVTSELKKAIDEGATPAGMTKKDILESKVYGLLKETPKFDMLIMGRGEGEGCYCLINSLLTDILDTLSKTYDITLMDTEAGLEHLSRRTDRDVDMMIAVTDPSSMGFLTAKRIKDVSREVHINFKRMYLVGVRFPVDLEEKLKDKAGELGYTYAGIIPYDENIFHFNLEGRSLLDLPEDSPAVLAVGKMLRTMGLV